MSFLRSCLWCILLAALLPLTPAVSALAHGGPPLRLGVTGDPDAAALARMVLVHLREGVGYAVDWRQFPSDGALGEALAAGALDIAVGLPAGVPQPLASPECPPGRLALLLEDFRRRWAAELFPLRFALGPDPCLRPGIAVSSAVLSDLRFGILGKEAGRIAALVTREDLAAVRAAAERGGERAATAAARAALAAKAVR